MTDIIKNLPTIERVRALMPRTWHAIFARFPTLREVQLLTPEAILSGRDVLVNSPTASGKTEAIVGPLAERLSPHRSQAPLLLIVAPTRALCNDLFRRIHKATQRCGFATDIKTGDDPRLSRERLPHIIITTPESFDSLLSRNPQLLRTVRALMLDEIHLMAQSSRGDQLSSLVARMRKLSENTVQVCAASATITDAFAVCEKYLNPDAMIVNVPSSGRSIDYRIAIGMSLASCARIIEALTLSHERRKVLVFANARNDVEELVQHLNQLPRLASKVFAHHGSLSKDERLRTERKFLDAPNAVCIATSTLELGIDIGDIDRTVLIGVPADVSALAQRIGRGNRRSGELKVVCLTMNALDEKRFEHLLECAKAGKFFPDPVAFRPTVFVQQALSLSFQNPKRWVTAQVLYDRSSAFARKIYDAEDIESILDSMTSETSQLMRRVGSKFLPEPKSERLFESGLVHTMLEDKKETEVVDAMTGRSIGSVLLSANEKKAIAGGLRPRLSLGGRGHKVQAYKEERLYVSFVDKSALSRFMVGESPRYSLTLAQDYMRFRGPEERPFALKASEGCVILEHYLGSVGGLLLASILGEMGCKVIAGSGNPFEIALTNAPDSKEFPDKVRCEEMLKMALKKRRFSIARQLEIGGFLKIIPEHVLDKWLESCVKIEDYANIMQNAVLFD